LGVGVRAGKLSALGFVDGGFGGIKVGFFEVEEVDFQAGAGVGAPDDEGGVVAAAEGFGGFLIAGGEGRGFDFYADVGGV
jgi:hypothetical protein